MTVKRLFVFVLVVLGVVPAAGESAAPQRIVALSYNIRHGEGMDKKIDLERVAGVIKSVVPDVVALQEVDHKAQRSNGVDQAAELARLTGMKMVFGRTIDLQGGQYGNAVLARLPIKEFSNHPLPYTNQREPRAVLQVELTCGLNDRRQPLAEFTFLATHFDFTPDSTDRLAAVAAIEKLIKTNPKQPMLLAGDLNSTPGSPALKALGKLWQVAGGEEVRPTVPVGKPRQQIDFILYRPADRWRIVEVRVLEEAVASDHRAIRAVLELLPAPALEKSPGFRMQPTPAVLRERSVR